MYDHNFVGAIPSLFYPHRWAIVHLATAPGQPFSNQLKQTFNGPARNAQRLGAFISLENRSIRPWSIGDFDNVVGSHE
jgi:hypothetical protein